MHLFSKSAVDYDSENGDDDTGDVEGADAGTDRDENHEEQRPDAVSTTKSPPPIETESIRESVAIESRNGFIESNNEVAVGAQDTSPPPIDYSPPTATVVADCSVNNGGCEQNCAVKQIELTGQHVIACSCNDGYALDIDNTHCIGE